MSMHVSPRPILGIAAAGFVAAALALPASAQDVTWERLLNPDKEPQNWINHHYNLAGWRYSPLKQINADTVKNMKLAFALALGGLEGGGRYANGHHEATPIVENGYMYIPDGWGTVYKIDVRTGGKAVIVWKMDPGTDRAWAGDVACCGVDNRGVALWKDKVISVTLDGRVIATNKATGEITWERKVADPAIAETITVAPLIVRDMAIVGVSGAEFGIRGWIDATDLTTGKQKWRVHTIPAKGEPGNETWKDTYNAWESGGGSTWVTGSYDPQLNLVYWGTGNPGPDWDSEYRPGDNLWTDSLIAVNPDTGKFVWGYQYTPNDPYDYDEIGDSQLVDITIGGQPRKAIAHAARNGHVYVIDRTNGQFIHGKQYTKDMNWTNGLDPKTGRPLTYDPSKDVQGYAKGSSANRANPKGFLCPTHVGAKNWEPAAYNPELKLLYIAGIEGCNQPENKQQEHFVSKGGTVKPRERFTGGGASWPQEIFGAITAFDVEKNTVAAKLDLRFANYSGVLATAGGLVFTGQYDGEITAHDAKTLKQVWSFHTGSGFNAPPMTYSVDGKQYIAIVSGTRQSAAVRGKKPDLTYMNPSSMLFVFAL